MPNSPTPNVYGFNAEATDYRTGIQYLRARYYDATINRFFQEDDYRGDFTSPASMNRYAYVHGNPVMGIDPRGYWKTPQWVKNAGQAIKNGTKMLHWEIYLGTGKGEIKQENNTKYDFVTPKYNNTFDRRRDLLNPTRVHNLPVFKQLR